MKTRNVAKVIIRLIAVLWVAGFIFGAGVVLGSYDDKPSQPATPAIMVTPPTEQDPDLLAKAAAMGIDVTNINLKYEPLGKDVRAHFGWQAVGTTETYTISVLPGMSTEQTFQSFAHEYYHYVWHTRSEIRLSAPLLRSAYKAYPDFVGRMQPYREDGLTEDSEQFADELYAITCTEASVNKLSQDILNYCSQGVPNRGMITSDF